MNLTGKRVLVVEDDAVNMMISEFILNKEGVLLAKAQHGKEAVTLVQGQGFDYILMDIEMPVLDGIAATRQIRQLPNGKITPIIALTAHSLPEKHKEFYEAGMNAHIVKPFDLDKFIDAIESLG